MKQNEQFTNTTSLHAGNECPGDGNTVDIDIPSVNEQPSGNSNCTLGSGAARVDNSRVNQQLKPHIKPGAYLNYKGKICIVSGLVRHSESLEWYVKYTEEDQEEPWVRPYEMFVEELLVNGRSVPRFQSLTNAIASSEEWQS